MKTFEGFGLSSVMEPLWRVCILRQPYSSESNPLALDGCDITGSAHRYRKTAAFAIPLVEHLKMKKVRLL